MIENFKSSRNFTYFVFALIGWQAIASANLSECRRFYDGITSQIKTESVAPALQQVSKVFEQLYKIPFKGMVYSDSEKQVILKELTVYRGLDTSVQVVIDSVKKKLTGTERPDILFANYILEKYQNDFLGLIAVDVTSPKFIAQALASLKLQKIIISREFQSRFLRLQYNLAVKHVKEIISDFWAAENSIQDSVLKPEIESMTKEQLLYSVLESVHLNNEVISSLSSISFKQEDLSGYLYYLERSRDSINEHFVRASSFFRDSLFNSLPEKSGWTMADIKQLLAIAEGPLQIRLVLEAAEKSFSRAPDRQVDLLQLSHLLIENYPEYTVKHGFDPQIFRQLDLAIEFQWRQIQDPQLRAQYLIKTLKALMNGFDAASTKVSGQVVTSDRQNLFSLFEKLIEKLESRIRSPLDSEHTFKEMFISFGNSGPGLELALKFATKFHVELSPELRKLIVDKIDGLQDGEYGVNIGTLDKYRSAIVNSPDGFIRMQTR